MTPSAKSEYPREPNLDKAAGLPISKSCIIQKMLDKSVCTPDKANMHSEKITPTNELGSM